MSETLFSQCSTKQMWAARAFWFLEGFFGCNAEEYDILDKIFKENLERRLLLP